MTSADVSHVGLRVRDLDRAALLRCAGFTEVNRLTVPDRMARRAAGPGAADRLRAVYLQ